MSDAFVFLEFFLLHFVVLAWAFWEYRKTSKLVEETRTKERALKQTGAASGTEASL